MSEAISDEQRMSEAISELKDAGREFLKVMGPPFAIAAVILAGIFGPPALKEHFRNQAELQLARTNPALHETHVATQPANPSAIVTSVPKANTLNH